MCYDVCCDEENNAHIFIGFYSELASECVFKGKRKMNSPTNRNNPTTIKDLVQKSQGQIEFLF